MSALTVGALTVGAHHGKRARITLSLSDIRSGVLSHGQNPSYKRDLRHWWLIVPSVLTHFTHDALSLQWAGAAPVHLTDEETR